MLGQVSAASCSEQGEEIVVLPVVNNSDPALPSFLKLLCRLKCMISQNSRFSSGSSQPSLTTLSAVLPMADSTTPPKPSSPTMAEAKQVKLEEKQVERRARVFSLNEITKED